MKARTVMAVGGHIGDMDLAAGPLLAQNVIDGGRSVLVALTPGERGHPRLTPEEYRQQKIAETQALAAAIGAEAHVFEDQSDGFLQVDEDVVERLVMLIREIKPDLLLAHWPRSLHTDHENACRITERARLLAGLPGHRVDVAPRHGVAELYYTENWEDAEGYQPDLFVEISEQARANWLEGISQQAFARGETYGFRYIDYYDAQLVMRGCLARRPYAVALSTSNAPALKELS